MIVVNEGEVREGCRGKGAEGKGGRREKLLAIQYNGQWRWTYRHTSRVIVCNFNRPCVTVLLKMVGERRGEATFL